MNGRKTKELKRVAMELYKVKMPRMPFSRFYKLMKKEHQAGTLKLVRR